MSHLVKKECDMSDLNTLLEAARELSWLVQENEYVKYFSGRGELCDYTLSLVGEYADHGEALIEKYNIGIQVKEGKIHLLHDDAMNGRDVMADGQFDLCTARIVNKLKQQYQVTATQKIAQRNKWRVVEQQRVGTKRILTVEV